MNEKEALSLIEEMIGKTREDIRDNGFYYYFWGWLVFVAAVSNFVLLQVDYYYHSLPWMILMPLGGVVSVIAGLREKKTEPRVKTYVSDSMNEVVKAFSISLFVVCFAMPFGSQWKAFYPTIMVVYAIWLFVSGGLLKFTPLKWGGYLNWACAVTGFVVASTEVHLVLLAAGVLGGFIIPGHMLNNRVVKHV